MAQQDDRSPRAPLLTNLALNRPVMLFPEQQVAKLTVDGNTDGTWAEYPWTALYLQPHNQYTQQYQEFPRAFWQVDLGVRSQIVTIRIWDRAACCGDNPAGGFLYIADNPITLDSFEPGTNNLKNDAVPLRLIPPENAFAPYEYEINAQGRFVTLLSVRGGPLRLSEVEVLGYPVESVATDQSNFVGCGETLYNGIVLPCPFPPDEPQWRIEEDTRSTVPAFEHMVPYLENPPEIIPVDVGRQLFVDDFLIESTTLTRTVHQPQKHRENPILSPEELWERQRIRNFSDYEFHLEPSAFPAGGGIWYDETRLFQMWYMCGHMNHTCYAQSDDGIYWVKPDISLVTPNTNIVWGGIAGRTMGQLATIWLDEETDDPIYRYKLLFQNYITQSWEHYVSSDGIIWWYINEIPITQSNDGASLFYNPFRNIWVHSIRDRDGSDRLRVRRYHESPAFADTIWSVDEQIQWFFADNSFFEPEGTEGYQLYEHKAIAYESLMLNYVAIWKGDLNVNGSKINEVHLAFSRDGFHWTMPTNEPFIPVTTDEQAWDSTNVQAVSGGTIIVGDEIYIYYSGRDMILTADEPYIESATGLATLRRDGFVSYGSEGQSGYLLTRPIIFTGSYLFVNANVTGALCVTIEDLQGNEIQGYGAANCQPIQGDSTHHRVTWQGVDTIANLRNRAVRLRFFLTDGDLYSFWISANEQGDSGGYLGAGYCILNEGLDVGC